MRAVIQKVTCAQVDVLLEEGRETVGRVSDGLMVLLGMGLDDDENDARYIADKTAGLRIFEDAAGKLNLSLQDTGGAAVSGGGRHAARARYQGGNGAFPDAYAGVVVQRRAGYASVGLEKNVLRFAVQAII